MKKNNDQRWLLLPALILSATNSYADPAFWQDIAVESRTAGASANHTFSHRRLQLQEAQLKALIAQTQAQTASTTIALSLPLPDGGFAAVRLIPTVLFAQSARGTHPNYLTWRIQSDDPAILSGRAELTDLGFHAMLRTRDGDQLFIEPEQRNTSTSARSYHSHSKQDNAALNNDQQHFSCGVVNTADIEWQQGLLNTTPELYAKEVAQRAGDNLLTYDLAIAATGEYTQKAGGTKKAALSAIATTVNRVNEIFERELAISFRLVTGTDTDTPDHDTTVSRLIFTDPATDPYSNGQATALLRENQVELDKLIGSQNYDIGHVLGVSSGGDGLAVLKSLCSDYKAQGTTSSSSSLGSDSFIVDFVAHELGHQLGATHTFNASNSGSCSVNNRTHTAAYEPGSGSSIMSYAGICRGSDFQYHADPQLHAKSIEQITHFTQNGAAFSCATKTRSTNQLPVVNAGANYTIPARTPFMLMGSASDSDGDQLLYSWDQIDSGSASALGIDTADNALIKSSRLSGSGLRHVPDISALLSQSQTISRGESLPRSNRTLNFRLSVRDGKKSQDGTIVYNTGAFAYDDTRLTVRDTGQRFEITSPGRNVAAGTQIINWNVAGTDQPPISCSHVDIAYTNDQGKTFTNLLTNTPNDGTASVQLSKAAQRIRVKCTGNIFYALSDTKPHIAAYQGASDQGSNDGNNGGNNGGGSGGNNSGGNSGNNNGGGGSLPAGLLLLTGLLSLIRRYSAIPN